MIDIRIFEITFPIFAIVAAGLLYARKFRPDMTLANRLNMDVFIPSAMYVVRPDFLISTAEARLIAG